MTNGAKCVSRPLYRRGRPAFNGLRSGREATELVAGPEYRVIVQDR
jgi:hypothetical protein